MSDVKLRNLQNAMQGTKPQDSQDAKQDTKFDAVRTAYKRANTGAGVRSNSRFMKTATSSYTQKLFVFTFLAGFFGWLMLAVALTFIMLSIFASSVNTFFEGALWVFLATYLTKDSLVPYALIFALIAFALMYLARGLRKRYVQAHLHLIRSSLLDQALEARSAPPTNTKLKAQIKEFKQQTEASSAYFYTLPLMVIYFVADVVLCVAFPHLWSGLLAVVPLCLYVLSFFILRSKGAVLYADFHELNQHYEALFVDAVYGMEDLTQFGGVSSLNEQLKDTASRAVQKRSAIATWQMVVTCLICAVFVLLWLGLLQELALLQLSANSQVNRVFSLMLLMGWAALFPFVISISTSLLPLTYAQSMLKKIRDYLTERAEPWEGSLEQEVVFAGITLHDVWTEAGILQGISLSLAPLESVFISSAHQAFRNDITQVLLGEKELVRGSVAYSGTRQESLTRTAILSNVSVVIAQTPIFPGTLRQNLRLGKPQATDDELGHALELFELEDLVEKLGDLGAVVDSVRAQTNLSGLARQKIGLARAYLTGAPCIVLNDATLLLTPAEEQAFYRVVQKVAPTRAWIMLERAADAYPFVCARYHEEEGILFYQKPVENAGCAEIIDNNTLDKT